MSNHGRNRVDSERRLALHDIIPHPSPPPNLQSCRRRHCVGVVLIKSHTRWHLPTSQKREKEKHPPPNTLPVNNAPNLHTDVRPGHSAPQTRETCDLPILPQNNNNALASRLANSRNKGSGASRHLGGPSRSGLRGCASLQEPSLPAFAFVSIQRVLKRLGALI